MYNKVDELVCYFVHVQQKMYIHLIKHNNVQKHEQLKCTSKCTGIQLNSCTLYRKNIVFCSFLVHCTEMSVHNFCTFRIQQILYILKNVPKNLYFVQK